MKTVIVFVALLFAMNCSKPISTEKEHSEVSVDSTVAYDTTSALNEGESEYKVEESEYEEEETSDDGESESDELSFVEESEGEVFFRELKSKITYDTEPYYYLNISESDQTETLYSSDITLYFDEKFFVLYYREDLITDDLIVATEFLLRDDTVVCSYEEERGRENEVEREAETEKSITQVCKYFGGTKITGIKGDEYEATERVPENYLDSKRDVINQRIKVLKGLLQDAEVKESNETLYDIIIINDDGTKVFTIKIEKALYRKLMN